MLQRYTVFLNDKVITIGPALKTSNKEQFAHIDFTDNASLTDAYIIFRNDPACKKLFVNTRNNFDEASKHFNSMFKRIEAAGGIIRNSHNGYLFIKRWGIWDLPKGKLHKNEPAQIGAMREVSEETGLTSLSVIKPLPSTFHIYTDRKGNEVLKETYWFEMLCSEDQKLVPQLEEDITEVRWFTAAELSIPVKNTYASLRQLLEQYLQE